MLTTECAESTWAGEVRIASQFLVNRRVIRSQEPKLQGDDCDVKGQQHPIAVAMINSGDLIVR
jgi:hypothetical protein